MPRRIGVMGGTFDPIHYGHLVAANEAADGFDLDEVMFIPAGDPWQKSNRDLTAAHHRLAMVTAAIDDNPRFIVSTIEIDRLGPSYAIDTLTALQAPETEVFFIMGADAFANINTWHQVDQLMTLAHFIVCTRPGHETDVNHPNATPIAIPQLDISSTMVRERIKAGQSLRYLTPDVVIDYITQHDLYKDNP